jgi:hypothetical protein
MANPSKAITSQGTAIRGVLATTTSVAFDGPGKTITRTVGSWLTEGFLVGMAITTSDGSNATVGTVTAVTALVLTVSGTVTTVAAASKIVTGKALIGEVKSFNGPGGQAGDIDVTTLESTAKEFRRGLQDEGEISLECNFEPTDPGQIFCRVARAETGSPFGQRNFEIVFPNSPPTTLTFAAFVKGFAISGGVDDVNKLALALRVTGPVTFS